MTDEAIGLTTGNVEDPGDLFACVEGTVERNLTTDRRVMGPSDREVILQAPRDQEQWLGPARANAIPALEQIEAYLGHEIPGDRSVVVRMTPPATLGGYASDHSTPGIVQFDECAGVGGADPEGKCAAHAGGAYHEMAHAWFGADRFGERWMREGLAQWVASRVNPEVTCPDISTVPADLDLSSWEVERPSAPDDVETIITEQQDASCAIMGVLADRIGEDQFKAVIASLLDAEEKYVGHAEPGRAVSDGVDWMEFLDAVDERGLVAAGDKDLDFAQNLLASYGVADDPTALEQRSALRARYHAFLDTATPLAAPAIVRREMDEWQFDDATVALDEADNVLDDLTSADDLLPEAGLVPFIQPDFEAAASLDDLALVRTQAATLLEAAKTILPPLNELRVVTPEEWTLPVGIRDAVTAQRFDDALAAVAPATSVAEDVTAANEALPEAGLLGRYKAEFEGATSADQLAISPTAWPRSATRPSRPGSSSKGSEPPLTKPATGPSPRRSWPPSRPRQISEALDIVRDARIVVASARQAEQDLPEAGAAAEFRPRFEAVADAAEMAALRVEAEAQAQTAKTIGESLTELKTTVPDWTLPAILTSPIEQHDFKTAAATLSAAATWVRFADQADQRLPQIEAKARTRESFEGAVTLDEDDGRCRPRRGLGDRIRACGRRDRGHRTRARHDDDVRDDRDGPRSAPRAGHPGREGRRRHARDTAGPGARRCHQRRLAQRWPAARGDRVPHRGDHRRARTVVAVPPQPGSALGAQQSPALGGEAQQESPAGSHPAVVPTPRRAPRPVTHRARC